ncbi:YebC/PmpR family DNA-binding transcriptional regulator [Candidatus Dojkabacteria bacterium]|nr:YebC/PmpR family DNA-binding transcriptional regulator [Candidatus Dojkabacteria bacterium]
MSGHSKWSTIKRKKGALDAKRGQIFTKLAKTITVCAREGGGDPDSNFSLRLAIDKAKAVNMPADNIDRAIKRGTGDLDGGIVMERAVYGGYGPGGAAIIVDVFTDNKNRSVSEIRKIFEDHGGNLAEADSVLWQFKDKGCIYVKCATLQKAEKFGEDDKEIPVDKDEVMMKLMDLEGIEDVSEDADNDTPGGIKICDVYTSAKDLYKVRTSIANLEFIIDSAEIVRIPDNKQALSVTDLEKLQTLIDALEEHDDVESVWTNVSD